MEEVFESAICVYNNERHLVQCGLNLAGSQCIRVYNSQGYSIDANGTCKSILRDIINQMNLDVSLNDSAGSEKNTHLLGQHTIRAINNPN